MNNHNLKMNSTVKVGKVSITQEKAGNYKLRFSHNGQRYSHGLGNIDSKKQWDTITAICQKIDIDCGDGRLARQIYLTRRPFPHW